MTPAERDLATILLDRHHDAVSITDNLPAAPGLGETVLNNHYGAETGASGVGSTDERAGAGDGPIKIGEPNAL